MELTAALLVAGPLGYLVTGIGLNTLGARLRSRREEKRGTGLPWKRGRETSRQPLRAVLVAQSAHWQKGDQTKELSSEFRSTSLVRVRFRVSVIAALAALAALGGATASASPPERIAPQRAERGTVDLYVLRSNELARSAASTSAPQARTCNEMTATIRGTPGDDHLVGSPGDDVIIGLGGGDRIEGRGGDDTICGGAGGDREIGGPGDDYMDGGDDQLAMLADAGKKTGDRGDVIAGGPGKDFIQSMDGRDVDNGGSGPDTVNGERGNDVVRGGKGDDFLGAGLTQDDPGHDRILGGPGDDVLAAAAAGNDLLNGGSGDDQLQGGLGTDRLVGGPGADYLGRPMFGDR